MLQQMDQAASGHTGANRYAPLRHGIEHTLVAGAWFHDDHKTSIWLVCKNEQ
jgi:hypothetical protein